MANRRLRRNSLQQPLQRPDPLQGTIRIVLRPRAQPMMISPLPHSAGFFIAPEGANQANDIPGRRATSCRPGDKKGQYFLGETPNEGANCRPQPITSKRPGRPGETFLHASHCELSRAVRLGLNALAFQHPSRPCQAARVPLQGRTSWVTDCVGRSDLVLRAQSSIQGLPWPKCQVKGVCSCPRHCRKAAGRRGSLPSLH
jgi:hypothetical protein